MNHLVTITRGERTLYLLGAPAAARLAQCVRAHRAGHGPTAMVAAGLALLSLLTSFAGALALLLLCWVGLHHHDVSGLILPVAALGMASVASGVLAEIPRITDRPGR